MDAFLALPARGRNIANDAEFPATAAKRHCRSQRQEHSASGRERIVSNFDMRRTVGQVALTRRRVLQATASAGLAVGLPASRLPLPASAQEVILSRDYEGTTLNLLMEDLLETTIIEEMLPEFTEMTGITVNFEKVAY